MSNDLNTILDDAGNRALVEKYLEKSFLERRDYDTVLANSEYGQTFRIPEKSGQYLEATRKGRFRVPQNVPASSLTADPASGATMTLEKVKFPMEWLHEFIAISTISNITSWFDLMDWAKEDLPMALKRRLHQLTQNAFKVGRYLPGLYAADGTCTTAFDTTVAATSVSMYGLTFNFTKAPAYFAGGKTAFSALEPADRLTMADFEAAANRLALAGAPKINGRYIAAISSSMKNDLMEDDKYFRTAVDAWGGKGMADGSLADYRSIRFVEDDEIFTENWGAAGVRATNGPIHTAMVFGKGAFAYTQLGANSRLKPKFKVQDITKTGGEKTIGYSVPMQVAMVNADYGCTLTGPVSIYTPNNA